MQERTSLEDSLSGIGKVEQELEDDIGMIELGEAEGDEGVVKEAEAALKSLKKEVARRELEALLELPSRPSWSFPPRPWTSGWGRARPRC